MQGVNLRRRPVSHAVETPTPQPVVRELSDDVLILLAVFAEQVCGGEVEANPITPAIIHVQRAVPAPIEAAELRIIARRQIREPLLAIGDGRNIAAKADAGRTMRP